MSEFIHEETKEEEGKMNDYEYRSDEERAMSLWLAEAVEHGLVDSWEYEPTGYLLTPKIVLPTTVQLKTKTKQVDRVILNKCSYTPDFVLKLSEGGINTFSKVFEKSMIAEPFAPFDTPTIVIDVKGNFQKAGKAMEMSLHRKLMWDKHKIYIEIVIPWKAKGKSFFKETWCPESLRWMKSRSVPTKTTKGLACKTVGEFINNINGGTK